MISTPALRTFLCMATAIMLSWWVSSASAAKRGTRRFAIVVAENRPVGDHLPQLRFADDDGVRYAQLFEIVGAEVELLAVLDADTQQRHPDRARVAQAPTRAALQTALARIDAGVRQARAEGFQTDFYFVYAGHGEVGPNREGRIHLRDGVLTRSAFLRDVVRASTADFNHVIIDACHASALVFRRGPDNGYRAEDFHGTIARYLDAQDLESMPNTGVLLAASNDQTTHEWEVFGAGVFSHEVRSGLLGAADVNRDGVVEYSEIAAFVVAANLSVQNLAARPQVVFHPPAVDLHHPLLDVTDGPSSFIRLPSDFVGRTWIEDERGDRYADFNPSGDGPLVVALAARTRYFLHRGGDETTLLGPVAGTFDGRALLWRPRRHDSRGATDDAFRRELYGVPFGRDFYRGFVSQTAALPAIRHRETVLLPPLMNGIPDETRFGPWPWVTGGAALVAGASAIALGLGVEDDLESFQRHVDQTGLDDPSQRARIDTRRRWVNRLAAAAAIGGVTTATLFWFNGPVDSQAFSVNTSGTGFGIGGAYRW